MTILKNKAFGVAAALLVAATVSPAYASSGNGTASVKILRAITVTKSSDLYFGKILPSATASTVAVAESGARTCGASLGCYDTATSGAFHVVGTSGEIVSVSLDSASTTLSDGASHSMTVNLATSTTALTLTGGAGDFKVAGTLNVGASQADGTYTGQYSVSVNYQ
ncbi:DUF4402 domain-containing protein [Sphingomonas sp. AR_OL41]|uniref:DUF4402 domain-containing protein n=1 Tax=Sphingomonas sp. AR_OL41 TaxID=3042729 RepID=UPI002480C973|nr:DUF4402 domain-containing protein [Sphingomonas sp. AR_OL41]MDH7973276.1 DUF4402 domain-containing protein [Sphingomonas sp. AR_OL41]